MLLELLTEKKLTLVAEDRINDERRVSNCRRKYQASNPDDETTETIRERHRQIPLDNFGNDIAPPSDKRDALDDYLDAKHPAKKPEPK